MNELQLSNDLTTIETEIKSYQNIAGQSIFEIGRRLKHVKDMINNGVKWGKTLEGTKRRWKACVMHEGPFQTSNPLSIFVG